MQHFFTKNEEKRGKNVTFYTKGQAKIVRSAQRVT